MPDGTDVGDIYRGDMSPIVERTRFNGDIRGIRRIVESIGCKYAGSRRSGRNGPVSLRRDPRGSVLPRSRSPCTKRIVSETRGGARCGFIGLEGSFADDRASVGTFYAVIYSKVYVTRTEVYAGSAIREK